MRHCFIGSKMTVLNDVGDPQSYITLNWTEFLECLCRISMAFWDMQPDDHGGESYIEIEDKVFMTLEKLWEIRSKKKDKGAKGKKKKKFPELKPVVESDSESDWKYYKLNQEMLYNLAFSKNIWT